MPEVMLAVGILYTLRVLRTIELECDCHYALGTALLLSAAGVHVNMRGAAAFRNWHCRRRIGG
jgi:ABC-type uncharacterized transport system permease subunit